jgi:hypothetical protein
MEHFNKLMNLIDKVSPVIPEGDYIEMCNTLKSLRDASMSCPPPLRYEPTVVSTYVPIPPPYDPMDWEVGT